MTPTQALDILETIMRAVAHLQRGIHRANSTDCAVNCADLGEVQALLIDMRARLEDTTDAESRP